MLTIATVNVQAADPGALPANAMQGLPANAVSDLHSCTGIRCTPPRLLTNRFIAWLVFGVGLSHCACLSRSPSTNDRVLFPSFLPVAVVVFALPPGVLYAGLL